MGKKFKIVSGVMEDHDDGPIPAYVTVITTGLMEKLIEIEPSDSDIEKKTNIEKRKALKEKKVLKRLKVHTDNRSTVKVTKK